MRAGRVQARLGHEDRERRDGCGVYRLAVPCAPADEPFAQTDVAEYLETGRGD